MSRGRKPARRSHSSLLNAARSKSSGPTPWWQWVLGIPLLAALAVAVGFFLYVNFVTPDARVTVRSARVPVIASGVEEPEGLPPRAYVTVRLADQETRLYGTEEVVSSLAEGAMVDVDYKLPPVGAATVIKWAPATSPTPATGGDVPSP